MKNLIIILLLTVSFISCRKDKKKTLTEEPVATQMTLTDSLVGIYEGTYTRRKEVFDCQPDCYPPCDQTITYDTSYISIEIQKINNDSVRVVDNMFEEVNSHFPIDSSASYEGNSQSQNSYLLTLSELKVYWTDDNYDSLYIEHNFGAGGSCGGTFYHDNYSLQK